MARMLSVLNGGEVARRLGVSRAAVSEWSRSTDPPPLRVQQVRELLLAALGQQEGAAPDWERLMAQVDAIAQRLGVSEEQAVAAGVDAALAQLPDAGSEGDPAVDDPSERLPTGRRGR